MKERWIKIEPEADERQEQRLAIWLSGSALSFESATAEDAYRGRVTLLKEAIQLKKAPSRVPVCPSAGFFPMEYAGISVYDAMYDYDKLARAWQKYCEDFNPDAFNSPVSIVPGRVCDVLDLKLYKWPGHGVPKECTYQFVEGEYMKAEEYRDFIDDPTGFFMRVYFPRIFGKLQHLQRTPLLPLIHEMPCVPPGVIPFGTPEVQAALNALMEAGAEGLKWMRAVRALSRSIMGKGCPSFSGGFSKAPFDAIGDTLRGTTGILMDLYRHPDELLEACERMTPFMVKTAISDAKASGHLLIFMPLHKGADGFMSDKQFRTFYWPTLRKVIIGLINEGLVPLLFAEGCYNSRLEVISDLPKGKTVWWFDQTDMARAKQTVGRVSCIAGNVPLDLLGTGTPDDVKEYCRKLIDVAGRDGGFILSTGAGMEGSNPANVKSMIDFSREYGRFLN